MKLKTLALASAMVLLSGAASATVVGSRDAGPGTISLSLWDRTNQFSVFFDLGLDTSIVKSGAFGAAGTSVVWDFKANTITSNVAGWTVTGPTDNSWSSIYNSMVPTMAADSVFSVWGMDTAPGYLLTTSRNAPGSVSNTNLNNVAVNTQPYQAAQNALGTNPSFANGASTASATDLGAASDAYQGKLVGTRFAGSIPGTYDITSPFADQARVYIMTNLAAPNATVTRVGTEFNGTAGLQDEEAAFFAFNAQAGTLTYTVPSVPEPGTYALMFAGMAAVAFVSRRRRAA